MRSNVFLELGQTRRLPGIGFEVKTPPQDEVLPRMDVAVFVGFAASGPLNVPVAVEDIAQFETIFGRDLPLVYDPERSATIYAYLAPTVRAFFQNGGKRCYIVRVAGDGAKANRFPIPNLIKVSNDNEEPLLLPAVARARSRGSWSDSLRVGTALMRKPINLIQVEPFRVVLELPPQEELYKGDLLRLVNERSESFLFFVKEIKPLENFSSPPDLVDDARVIVETSEAFQLWPTNHRPIEIESPFIEMDLTGLTANIFFLDREQVTSPTGDPHLNLPSISVQIIDWEFANEGGKDNEDSEKVSLTIDFSEENIPVNTLVTVNDQDKQLIFVVEEVFRESNESSPLEEVTRLVGTGQWLQRQVTISPIESGLDVALKWHLEKLNLEMWIKEGETLIQRLGNLGFHSDHPNFWGNLPTAEAIYQSPEIVMGESVLSEVVSTHFPLAGMETESIQSDVQAEEVITLPISMLLTPRVFLKPLISSEDNLSRNGLAKFNAQLFLDEDLHDTKVFDLIQKADYLLYQKPSPKKALNGIHAALKLEEATIIAVPDAVHCQWDKLAIESPKALEIPADEEVDAEYRTFENCTTLQLPSLALELSENTEQKSFTMLWSVSQAEAVSASYFYRLEELQPGQLSFDTIYKGQATSFTLIRHNFGEYHYRVRIELEDGTVGDWSDPVIKEVAPDGQYKINSESYNPEHLLRIQQELLRLCASRGDLLAVLNLPKHYREDEVLTHVTSLKASTQRQDLDPQQTDFLLPSESKVFDYGVLYHPWLVTTGINELSEVIREVPPDGAISGKLANVALQRGAWQAPANVPLLRVIALEPPLSSSYWPLFQNAQVNIVRQEPQGFLVLNSDTLSVEPTLRPINVKRLLMLLRRLALKYGPTYVFEPNSEQFRRTVKRGFERILSRLHEQGAFAGNSAEESYQVIVDDTVNPQQSIEQGRFIVELRVAPSLPLSFLKVRLVQTANSLVVN